MNITLTTSIKVLIVNACKNTNTYIHSYIKSDFRLPCGDVMHVTDISQNNNDASYCNPLQSAADIFEHICKIFMTGS